MGEAKGNEHLGQVAAGLQKMSELGDEADRIFLGAKDKVDQALEQLDQVIPALLGKMVEGFDLGAARLGDPVSLEYVAAWGHLKDSGMFLRDEAGLGAPIEHPLAERCAEVLRTFEEQNHEASDMLDEVVVLRVNQLSERLSSAEAPCRQAFEATVELLDPMSEVGLIALDEEVSHAQRLQRQLNTPKA